MQNDQGTLQLVNAREIRLYSLRQIPIYDGLLEGLPTSEMNQRRLERYIAEQREIGNQREPYLIPAEETPIEYAGKYPFGTPASLPRILCVGQFQSFKTGKQLEADFSLLDVIWLQHDWAFPIEATPLNALLAIDWETHATDGKW